MMIKVFQKLFSDYILIKGFSYKNGTSEQMLIYRDIESL